MVIGTPVLLNPNSHENIDKILSKLKTNLRIADECQWTFLGRDRPLFCIANYLVEINPDNYDWVSEGPQGCES